MSTLDPARTAPQTLMEHWYLQLDPTELVVHLPTGRCMKVLPQQMNDSAIRCIWPDPLNGHIYHAEFSRSQLGKVVRL